MNAQTEIQAKYGLPGLAYEQKYCILWHIAESFPELSAVFPHAVEINSAFANCLHNAFTALKLKGLLGQLKTFDGCLQQRKTRGSAAASLHSWAMAIDLNAKENPMQFTHVLDPFTHSDFTKDFVDIMEAAGLFWGGYYAHRFDPMHFALYNG